MAAQRRRGTHVSVVRLLVRVSGGDVELSEREPRPLDRLPRPRLRTDGERVPRAAAREARGRDDRQGAAHRRREDPMHSRSQDGGGARARDHTVIQPGFLRQPRHPLARYRYTNFTKYNLTISIELAYVYLH